MRSMFKSLRIEIIEFIKYNYGKLLLVVGLCFLVLGMLSIVTLSETYPVLCGIGFLFGIPMMGVGFLVELDFYSSSSLSGKFGSIFVTTSLLFFAGVLASLSFKVVVGSRTVAVIFHGEIIGWRTVLITAYPYGWLALPLLIVGVILLGVGVALKFYSEVL